MSGNDCESCRHKKQNEDPALHCYMFKTEPAARCFQHTNLRVGTIGHVGSGRTSLVVAALSILAQQSQAHSVSGSPRREGSEPDGQETAFALPPQEAISVSTGELN